MRKILYIFIFFFIISFSVKAYGWGCTPTFPALWPPSITSTEATNHSVSITWSMGLPVIGDITAYRIYLNGALVHTIPPSITSLLFSPAGHGAYSVQGLKPDTVYNEAVGVVFAIPVGCGITWNVQMKSSANIKTQPANWLQNAQNGKEAVSNGYQSSKPNGPDVKVSDITQNSATVSYNISNAYQNTNFTQKKYKITKIVIEGGDVCQGSSFSPYVSNYAFYTGEEGYNLRSNYDCRPQRYIYYTGEGRNKKEHVGEKYKYDISGGGFKKTIDITGNTGFIKLNLEPNTPYVCYGYVENSNGDKSDLSKPLQFLTPKAREGMRHE